MYYQRLSYGLLPNKPGVYLFLNKENTVLYVGKANDLKNRVSSYFAKPTTLGDKTRALVDLINKIKIVVVESEIESLLLEAYFVKKYEPKYNVRLTDGKSYPLIRITIHDQFPAVLLARRPEDKNSLYFGPYPSTQSVKTVLKLLRRVFPFHSVSNHPKKLCLYNHLGLCPCLPVNDTKENRLLYKKSIKKLICVLEGKSRKIIQELERERDAASKYEQYDQAAIFQKKITAMNYITTPFHKPFEYDVNPNLQIDMREKELQELRIILEQNGYQIDRPIKKIECYDISHIQGTNTTASLVVFIDGEKESSLYRKFKIRLEKTPDDFASMKEVLQRRIKHTEWEYPDLFIVDGGKGQVSAALEVLNQHSITIPLIGLAKRIETIVIPLEHPKGTLRRIINTNSNPKQINDHHFREIVIPYSVGALKLLQRIRDEAHRFAITYHKKLRSKLTFS